MAVLGKTGNLFLFCATVTVLVAMVIGEPQREFGQFIDDRNWFNYGYSGFNLGRYQGDIRDCSDPNNPYYPDTVTDTTDRIKALREEMKKISTGNKNVRAYIVPANDAHQVKIHNNE
ncbi:uncharacterized protein LOC144350018 [Saccoglossus kowalevskii]